MASLLSGFEYDVFISYRHNDNRSGWVTEFVRQLNEELAATIKEPLSVYFDNNRHDGLLETHNVDKSLEGKLKCLIFIPILSQTYCDARSFAWQHEFCAFNKLVKEDRFGRDVKGSNGNVTSRILPVRIHDLDAADKTSIEKEIESVLRGIEFIYKEPGVNRPLLPSDSKNENQNKTDYRNQVNKVANAIKDIVTSLSRGSDKQFVPQISTSTIPKNDKHRIAMVFTVVVPSLLSIAIATLLGYYFWKPSSALESGSDSSILVLPFRVDEKDSSQRYFAEGITSDLIFELGKVSGLSPLSWYTSLNYRNTNKSLAEISNETNALYVLVGNVQRTATTLRIYVELANPKDNKAIWTNTYDKKLELVLDVQKEIAIQVAEALRIGLSQKERTNITATRQTSSFKAYDLYLQARAASRKLNVEGDSVKRIQLLLDEALAIDPNFAEALTLKAFTYIHTNFLDPKNRAAAAETAKETILRSVRLDPESADTYIVMGGINLFLEWKIEEARKNFEKGWKLSSNGSLPMNHCICAFSQFNLATGDFQRTIDIVNTVEGNDPFYPWGPMEKFLAYQGLKAKEPMEKIARAGEPLLYTPVYEYALGNFENSIAAFHKLDTNYVRPYAHLASSYFKAGHTQLSDSIINILMKDEPDHSGVDFQLAVVYAARGDKKKALEWYVKAYARKDFYVLFTRICPDLEIIMEEPEVKRILKEIGV